MNTDESCGAKDESDGESGDEEYEDEFNSGEDEGDNDFVLNDVDEKSNSWQTIQFTSDEQRGRIMCQNHTVCFKGDHVSAQLSQQKSSFSPAGDK